MSYEIFEKLKKEIFARGIFSVFLLILLLPLAKASVILNATDFIGFNISANEIARIVSGGLIVSGGWVNATNANFSQICLGGNCKTSWPANLVGGTGSANYIAKWQDPNTLTSSVIYESGGNIGIGATNPGAKLHIQGGKLYVDPNNFGGSAAISLAVGDTDTGLNSAGDGQLDIYSNNVNTMSIRSGNVGIGTTAPGAKLHVASTGEAIRIMPNTMAGGEYASIFFRDPDGGTGPMEIRYTDDGSADLAILGGNVGIGTTAPGEKLEVAGNVKITGSRIKNSAGYGIVQTDATDWLRINPDSNYPAIALYNPVAIGTGGLAIGEWSQQPSGVLKVTQSAYLATAGGNVGIGTTAPGARLEVIHPGETQTSYTARFRSSPSTAGAGGILFDQGSTYSYKLYTVGTGLTSGQLILDYINYADGSVVYGRIIGIQSGNVGIGTINPGAKLDVQGGNIRWGTSSLTTDQGGAIELGNSSGSGNAPYIDFHYGVGASQDYNVRIQNDANGRLKLEASTLYITGNLGIGTTTPSSKLEVYGGDIEINDGQANGTYKIKGLRVFYAGDETQVSTTSTSPELKKQFTSVFSSDYGIKPNYVNVIARIWNSAAGSTTYLNVTLEGCNGITLSATSTSATVVKGTINVGSCSDGLYPTKIYLYTTSGGTAYNDVIEFYYVE